MFVGVLQDVIVLGECMESKLCLKNAVSYRFHSFASHLLSDLNSDLSLDPESLRIPRSHRGGPRKVFLPEGWLNDPNDVTPPPAEAEVLVSGG